MSEWDMNVQRIIDLAERGLKGELSLEAVSRRLGYSPWYCTRQFSRVVGMSLRSYLRLRRLSEAAIALRDGRGGILEVAVEYGFSSQEAFTRAFKAAWGMAPGAWRDAPRPIPLVLRDIPAADYLVFHHPPYDFAIEDAGVWGSLKEAFEARSEPPEGYAWNPAIPTWQRHDPEGMGQAWCRALERQS